MDEERTTGCPTFGEAVAELRGMLSRGPNSISDRYMLDLLGRVEEAHGREVATLRAEAIATRIARDRWSDLAMDLTPLDRGNNPIRCGDVVDALGTVAAVAGVDDRGGVFYTGEDDQWAYAHGRDCVVIDTLLGDDPHAPTALWEVAEALRDAYDDPDAHGNGDEMAGLIERLCDIACAVVGER